MHYPIPTSHQEIVALQQKPVTEELVASAIAGVVKVVRSQGQSLDYLTSQVLADDSLLDLEQRRWLCKVVTQVWENVP